MRIASAALLATAAVIVLWIRLVPLALPNLPARAEASVRQRLAARLAAEVPADVPAAARAGRIQRAVDAWIAAHAVEHQRDVAAEAEHLEGQLRAAPDDGGHVLLGDYDSYLWLRQARSLLRTGSQCDAMVQGECRATFALGPVGQTMRTAGSPHVAAIAAVNRLAAFAGAAQPLPTSAYWVPVLVGVLGVLPAFAIGRRLAGPIGGFFAAIASALHPVLLQRSIGSDNDVWNVVLPLYMGWALTAALGARKLPVQIAAAAAAGAVAGLHAATWRGWVFGFAVMLAGLVAGAALHAARLLLRSAFPPFEKGGPGGISAKARTATVSQSPPTPLFQRGEGTALRTTIVVALAFYFSTAVCTAVAGSEDTALSASLQALSRLRSTFATPAAAADGSAASTVDVPSALSTVGELWAPTLGVIASYSYGPLLFFVGWLGLLLLLLPRAGWQPGHFVVLIAGTLLYRYLLTAQLGRLALLVMLALPPLAAVGLHASAPQAGDEDDAEAGAGMLVVVWLLAALFLAFDAVRFVLLLAAPLGLAAGVAVGRLHLWLDAQAARQVWLPARLGRALAGIAIAALAILPARQGYATAAAFLPFIDRAWVDTLERLRDTTPPDAIVNAWWDYGYWIAYYGERRPSADGGTLLTHAPYWVARAQLAPSDAEAAGLLRMLDCGSDATPLAEGARGAYGRLVDAGVDSVVAVQTLAQLAPLSRADAERELARRGLPDTVREGVLAATHCTPPESYLVLTSDQLDMVGWWSLGTWDPRRVHLARTLRQQPENEAMHELTGELGYDEAEARRLYRAAQVLDTPAQLDAFGAPRGRFFTPRWVDCTPSGSGEQRCPVGVADASGRRIDAVVYPSDAPQRAVFEIGGAGANTTRETPSLVLVAGPERLQDIAHDLTTPTAVLLDPGQHRALVGTQTALRSTYAALMYLDGRYAPHFRKVDDRVGSRGERVVTWRIIWPES